MVLFFFFLAELDLCLVESWNSTLNIYHALCGGKTFLILDMFLSSIVLDESILGVS